jgi:prefoldin subunit 5
MSIYRQNSVDDVQSIYGSKLMVKDSQIQKLQNEVAELTQAKLDYQHSEEALDKLKKRVADI